MGMVGRLRAAIYYLPCVHKKVAERHTTRGKREEGRGKREEGRGKKEKILAVNTPPR